MQPNQWQIKLPHTLLNRIKLILSSLRSNRGNDTLIAPFEHYKGLKTKGEQHYAETNY